MDADERRWFMPDASPAGSGSDLGDHHIWLIR
jgi:hypothetical protein